MRFTNTNSKLSLKGQPLWIFKNIDWCLIGSSKKKSPQGNPPGITSKNLLFFVCFFSEKNFFRPVFFKNPKMKRITLTHNRGNVPGTSRATKTFAGVLIGTKNRLSLGWEHMFLSGRFLVRDF
jgi:hypothetical protein